MKIIGCDFHPGYQQIAVLDLATGEILEKALSHERKEEVRGFYAGLEGSVRVGIEASGQSQWFERMLAELGHEVWIGDASRLSTIGSAEVSCAGESSHGTKAGSEVVLDAALAGERCAADPGFACRTARHILWSWLRPGY